MPTCRYHRVQFHLLKEKLTLWIVTLFRLLLSTLPCDGLLRFAKNRVLFRSAPPKTGKPGAPKKDGMRFACHDEATHGPPDTF